MVKAYYSKYVRGPLLRLGRWLRLSFRNPTDLGFIANLYARRVRADGVVEDYGLVSTKVVTDAFVYYMVDSLQSTQANWVNFKYHGAGIGAGAEAVGNTTLGSEVGTRATGSQGEGATANVYRSIGTLTFSNTYAITEHGLFNASSVGTLMDRSVFAAINVVSGDSIEFTYDLTVNSGG